VPCPSAADPGRNKHRTGASWTLGTLTTILQNPRCTGRQVWNRQRTDTELADPGNVTLGHKSVQRWNLHDGWVISDRPAHPALVSEEDFIAAQDINAASGPVPQGKPVLRRYLLAGLLACGLCGRRMESAWSNGRAAYRCRHGRTSATTLTLAQQRRMTFWTWSVDTEDWNANGSSSSYWVNRIISLAEKGGSLQHPVLLMHNQPAGNTATVRLLRQASPRPPQHHDMR
jgi:Recombinase/Recombinase zinc beta ribbon domain